MNDKQVAGQSPLEEIRDQNIDAYMSLIAKHGGMTVDVQLGSAVYVFPVEQEMN